jgi:hypothetical protein
MKKRRKRRSWITYHSLSFVAVALLIVWIIGYRHLGPKSHLGAFFGNAVADWSGSVVIIIGTKFFVEAGSAESRPVYAHKANPIWNFLWRHSLLLFIVITGVGWTALYLHLNPQSKWGQVVGNIISEWVQRAGLVLLTKELVERGSKESRKSPSPFIHRRH